MEGNRVQTGKWFGATRLCFKRRFMDISGVSGLSGI